MSKELKIRCPSGATLLLTGEDVDNPKLLQAVEEYKKTFHGENFYEFDLFEKQPKMKKQYSSKQRKIHKLKRENVVLGRWREQMLVYGLKNSTLRCHPNGEDELTKCFDFLDAYRLSHLSFEMGKNSAKIQRLRTQIQQSKSLNASEERKLNEHSSVT